MTIRGKSDSPQPRIVIEFDVARVCRLEPGAPYGVPIGGHKQAEVYVVLRDPHSEYVKDEVHVFALEPDPDSDMLELKVSR